MHDAVAHESAVRSTRALAGPQCALAGPQWRVVRTFALLINDWLVCTWSVFAPQLLAVWLTRMASRPWLVGAALAGSRSLQQNTAGALCWPRVQAGPSATGMLRTRTQPASMLCYDWFVDLGPS